MGKTLIKLNISMAENIPLKRQAFPAFKIYHINIGYYYYDK
jgi:hypothetical protein